jgi:hypothetical protein
VWRSRDPFAERILIDDFHLVDVCPDCVIDQTSYTPTGCFDAAWVSSVRSNYYYYSVTITDSASTDLIFRDIHKPARFSWDGYGNQGGWDGVLVPYNQPMRAILRYYSCLKQSANIQTLTYFPTREPGCIDVNFGGSKQQVAAAKTTVGPVPVSNGERLYVTLNGLVVTDPGIFLYDLNGRQIHEWKVQESDVYDHKIVLYLPNLPNGLFQLLLHTNKGAYTHLIQVTTL